jgi:hypothetical protein
MSSIRDQITAAAVALLGESGKPAGLAVSRQRTVSLSDSDLPAQCVYAVQEEANASPGFGSDRKAKRVFRLCVESRVNAENLSGDKALDPLLSWSVQQLCADVTLGGLSYELREIGTTWDESEQDKMYAAARQFFEISYLTDAYNPNTIT